MAVTTARTPGRSTEAATAGPIARLIRFPEGVGTEIAWNPPMTAAQSNTSAQDSHESPDRYSRIVETAANDVISKNNSTESR